jgi:hypothetical protein
LLNNLSSGPTSRPDDKQPDNRVLVVAITVISLVVPFADHPAFRRNTDATFESVPSPAPGVLDVIGKEGLRRLRQAAVFAMVGGPFADELPQPLIHQAA